MTVIDTNLLLLLAIGDCSPEYIVKHKRCAAYSIGDYRILLTELRKRPGIRVTPNVVTETDNLLRQTSRPVANRLSNVLRELLADAVEVYVPSGEAMRGATYLPLGLADTSLIAAAQGSDVILTADVGLYLAASQAGKAVVNFNHLRDPRPR